MVKYFMSASKYPHFFCRHQEVRTWHRNSSFVQLYRPLVVEIDNMLEGKKNEDNYPEKKLY